MRPTDCPHRPPCPGCPRYGEPGIDAEGIARLAALARRDALVAPRPARLVYASCGLDAFLRDAARLLDDGTLRLTALEAWVLFPYTTHVETAARFEASPA